VGDKKHREKKKAKGICVNCTKRAVAGKTRCKDCAERDAREARRRNIKYRKYRKDILILTADGIVAQAHSINCLLTVFPATMSLTTLTI